jgi:predicted phage tail protein
MTLSGFRIDLPPARTSSKPYKCQSTTIPCHIDTHLFPPGSEKIHANPCLCEKHEILLQTVTDVALVVVRRWQE